MEILRGRTGRKAGQHLGRPVGLARLCALFGQTRSGWYQHQERQLELAIEHELVVQQVLELRAEQPRLGTRKLYQLMEPFLRSHGIKMGRDALFSLLESHGLLIRRRKKKGPKTTDGTGAPRWPNLLKDGLSITAPCQVWATDITYVASERGGWRYLMALIDLFSRKIVGWHLEQSMDAEACLQALCMALEAHPGLPEGLIHHSDRGSQYRSGDYLKCLKTNKIKVSMCEKPQENGASERLNGIIKNEVMDEKPLPEDLLQARETVARAVLVYNRKRPHDSLGGLFPEEVHAGKAPLPPLWKPRKKKAEQGAGGRASPEEEDLK